MDDVGNHTIPNHPRVGVLIGAFNLVAKPIGLKDLLDYAVKQQIGVFALRTPFLPDRPDYEAERRRWSFTGLGHRNTSPRTCAYPRRGRHLPLLGRNTGAVAAAPALA